MKGGESVSKIQLRIGGTTKSWAIGANDGHILCQINGSIDRIETYSASTSNNFETFMITYSLGAQIGFVPTFSNTPPYILLGISNVPTNYIHISAFRTDHSFITSGSAATNMEITIGGKVYYGCFVTSNAGSPAMYALSSQYYGIYNQPLTDSLSDLMSMITVLPISSTKYPITYSYSNAAVSGVTEAAIGDTVVVSAVPNINYGITDQASQIIVTNNDVAVPYEWNPSTNTITFTMPDPT